MSCYGWKTQGSAGSAKGEWRGVAPRSDAADEMGGMSDRRAKALDARIDQLGPGFLEQVEAEMKTLDWAEFREFLEADSLPLEPREGFERELRERLREFVRLRLAE